MYLLFLIVFSVLFYITSVLHPKTVFFNYWSIIIATFRILQFFSVFFNLRDMFFLHHSFNKFVLRTGAHVRQERSKATEAQQTACDAALVGWLTQLESHYAASEVAEDGDASDVADDEEDGDATDAASLLD